MLTLASSSVSTALNRSHPPPTRLLLGDLEPEEPLPARLEPELAGDLPVLGVLLEVGLT